MNKNLLAKTILIIAVLIVFMFGIFGIPKSFTPQGLVAALQSRIHLGLDLKGGTHLILQVQVNDAVNADTDRTVERLKEDLKGGNIAFVRFPSRTRSNVPKWSRSRAYRRNRRESCGTSSAIDCRSTI